jgi:hypothetical protein
MVREAEREREREKEKERERAQDAHTPGMTLSVPNQAHPL